MPNIGHIIKSKSHEVDGMFNELSVMKQVKRSDIHLKFTQARNDHRSKLTRVLTIGALVVLIFVTMLPIGIFSGERPANAAGRPAVFGYVTWGNLSASWNTTTVLGSITHMIVPAVVASSASNPSIVGMYGDISTTFPNMVSACHASNIKCLTYFYTGAGYTTLASIISAGTLSTLVASIENVILQYNLDGIDLDFEETMNPGNNTLVIDALYAALNPYGKIITLDGSYGEVPGVSPDVSLATAQEVDYIHVLAYDMWGYPDQNAGFPQSSYVDSVAAVQKWIDAGYSRSKLNMAIPFFGKCVKPYSVLNYSQIVDALNPTPNQDSGTINGKNYSWNGINTVKAKADWVMQNGVGGVMIFAIGYDKLNQSGSLLQVIANEMNSSSAKVQPSVITNAATNNSTSSATLNGNLTALGSASSVNVSFDYGLTTSYSNSTGVQAMTASGTFGTNLTSLTPGTLYHFRAKADGGSAGIAYGADQQFTTLNGANTTTALISATNLSVFGQPVQFTASVTPSAATGTITFKDGNTSLSTVSLSSGSASLDISTLSVGSHSITAVYNGDLNDTGSTSNRFSQTVRKANSATALSPSLNPANLGTQVTFTANVAAVAPGAGNPSGIVTFKDGSKTLGTVTLNAGQAKFTTSSLSSGTHSIKAAYGGDKSFAGSTSDTVDQVIN